MHIPFVAGHFEHDANICFEYEDKLYSYELERITKERYFNMGSPTGWQRCLPILEQFKHIILKEFDVSEITFNTLIYNEDLAWAEKHGKSIVPETFQSVFDVKNISEYSHHDAHAAGAFGSSPFEESIVISYDGGGTNAGVRGYANTVPLWDFFVIYHADRCGLTRLVSLPVNMGGFYNTLCSAPKEIQWTGNTMAGCGKLMGLSGHANPDPLVINRLKSSFFDNPFYHKDGRSIDINGFWMSLKFFESKYNIEKPDYNIKELPIESRYDPILDLIDSFDHCADYASNWQEAFTQIVLELIEPYVSKYNLPICLAGGCALNVLTNERIRTYFNKPVYVPPNPSDCGLAMGAFYMTHPEFKGDVVYQNFDLLDRHKLQIYAMHYNAVTCDIPTLADIIVDGKIVGVANGRSECGPRALGNRSILCNPSIPDMKDTLNAKVKQREWYRPFAPMVRYEDRNTYFNFDGDSPYMSFACTVRKQYQKELSAITHIDGTARIQTVTKDQNSFIYDLLTEIEHKGEIPVLLNTSFNIKGKPILTSIEDSLYILNNTEMDNVYIEGHLFGG